MEESPLYSTPHGIFSDISENTKVKIVGLCDHPSHPDGDWLVIKLSRST